MTETMHGRVTQHDENLGVIMEVVCHTHSLLPSNYNTFSMSQTQTLVQSDVEVKELRSKIAQLEKKLAGMPASDPLREKLRQELKGWQVKLLNKGTKFTGQAYKSAKTDEELNLMVKFTNTKNSASEASARAKLAARAALKG